MKIRRNLAISDSGFLFNPSTGDSFSLNNVGKEILNQLKEGKTQEEIKSKVLSKYQTDEGTFDKDFFDFINQLRNYKILENE